MRREFRQPLERGGCGAQWGVLEERVRELPEPDWALVGQLWYALHPGEPRVEEQVEARLAELQGEAAWRQGVTRRAVPRRESFIGKSRAPRTAAAAFRRAGRPQIARDAPIRSQPHAAMPRRGKALRVRHAIHQPPRHCCN